MLGKQWLNHYGQNEISGSTVDRYRMRERIETWKFHAVMESLPPIPQYALVGPLGIRPLPIPLGN